MANRWLKGPTKVTYRYVGDSKEGEARQAAAFDLIIRRAFEFRERAQPEAAESKKPEPTSTIS